MGLLQKLLSKPPSGGSLPELELDCVSPPTYEGYGCRGSIGSALDPCNDAVASLILLVSERDTLKDHKDMSTKFLLNFTRCPDL